LPAWEPLVLLQPGGRALVASLLAAILVFRFSRKKLPVADLLMLAAFSFVFGGGIRMAWWYAAAFGLAVTPHLGEIGTRWVTWLMRGRQTNEGERSRRWLGADGRRALSYTVMSVGVLWICFAISPVWDSLVRGRPRPPERLYGGGTPWKLSQHLRENPPQGQVFHPHWWGDWLIWDGPTGLRPFLTTNLNLVLPKVWIDYRIIRETRSGWADVLLRYGARTVILDRYRQTTLLRFLRDSDQWELQYEDELSLVFAQVEGKASLGESKEDAEPGVSIDE
jgi:hypothetical protein